MSMLKITIYDGEYSRPMACLARLCEIEGSVTPFDRPPFSVLEEALRVLEMCADRYSIQPLSGTYFTVAIGRKVGDEVTPLLRLDGCTQNGWASASAVGQGPRWDTAPVRYEPGDDAVEIVRKILAGQLQR
ncbi:hypothetical protein ACFPTO_20090 [Paraburkholderia denitrificans]|uniref:Uncharacterized protein n=1 Tax=Paraburkholderia denitrificans TaxID=694025 RepID=A0ABW0JDH8_9BURK